MSNEVSLGVLRHSSAPVEGEAPVGRHGGLHPQPLDWQALDEVEPTAENHLVAESLQLGAQAGEGELRSTDILRVGKRGWVKDWSRSTWPHRMGWI